MTISKFSDKGKLKELRNSYTDLCWIEQLLVQYRHTAQQKVIYTFSLQFIPCITVARYLSNHSGVPVDVAEGGAVDGLHGETPLQHPTLHLLQS